MASTTVLQPGFMVIHSNRMEQLRDVLVQWTQANPLTPLEQEVVLVQSNGMAQWLKYALADDTGWGIAAGVEVSLPARFLWQAYRAVLPELAAAQHSPLDKSSLTWRLMRVLPKLLDRRLYAPLAGFLADDQEGAKLHVLSAKIADIFDQYQVYRADWLERWAQGEDDFGSHGQFSSGDENLRQQTLAWQADLWRQLLADIGSQRIAGSRASVHPEFIKTLKAAQHVPKGLPRRVIVFGISSLPEQTLQALSAMAKFSQIILCVHNPCQHYWGDIVEDRDLLRRHTRRHANKPDMPEQLTLDNLHQHAHPLLAAWGKQGRDYIALLADYDSPETYLEHFRAQQQSIDIFEPNQGDTLLGQLQNDILELVPVAASRQHWPTVDVKIDQSIGFVKAHSPQREVEILRDQLLARFSQDPALKPRDIIVMVPNIDDYAPHIQAVFGQYDKTDERFVPFTVSDQGQRGVDPLLIALEQLLNLPSQRMTVADLQGLLDVPALRNRFGMSEDDVDLISRWVAGAGIRWGLNADQRADLGLPAHMQQNTWAFGLQRMLVGYAMGRNEQFHGIESYSEVAGLEAQALGPLMQLYAALEHLRHTLAKSQTPEQWAHAFHALLERFFVADTQADQRLMQNLQQAIQDWQEACEQGAFEQQVTLAVAREAWLETLDSAQENYRFLAGAINFCTLMPMRTIPFKQVCLLGMNDGDYPRAYDAVDFDLMAQHYRPGDRSRREDDRYLLLEALLAARQQLYISWVGFSDQDNSPRPPSVLIAQLRDHIGQVWQANDGGDLLAALTTEHPLNPFSRQYYDPQNTDLFTYASEWASLHMHTKTASANTPMLPIEEAAQELDETRLQQFLRRPVKQFFAERFKVYLEQQAVEALDAEPFAISGLEKYKLKQALLTAGAHAGPNHFSQALNEVAGYFKRSGQLPLYGFADTALETLAQPLTPQLQAYFEILDDFSQPVADAVPLQKRLPYKTTDSQMGELVFGARLSGQRLHKYNAGEQANIQALVGNVHNADSYRWTRLLAPWRRHVLLAAAGQPTATILVAEDGVLRWPALDPSQANDVLQGWLRAWLVGMGTPLPVAYKTSMAWLDRLKHPKNSKKPAQKQAYDAAQKSYNSAHNFTGEVDYENEGALRRQYPSFEALFVASVRGKEFAEWSEQLYGKLAGWPAEFEKF